MKPIIYMAPIQGVTNCVYRNVYSRFFSGYDYAVTPFIKNGSDVNAKSKAMRDLFVERNTATFRIVPQVLTNDPADFIVGAQAMFDLGYETVNLNLGCPHKRIRNKKRGSGLLPDPERIIRILHEVIPSIPNQVSLKVRLGSTQNTELYQLLPLLDDMPIKEIIIHPRIGTQMYAGTVDLDAFEQCLSLTRHDVVYNGDIDSLATFQALSERFPTVHRWMIGRAGIINPFLPEQIKGIFADSAKTQRKRFANLHNVMFAAYQEELSGPGHLIDKMKELWCYWAQAFEGGKRVVRKISLTRNVENYTDVVRKFFDTQPSLRI